MTQAVRSRHEIPVEETWDATNIFPSDEAWQREMEALGASFRDLSRHQGHLGDGPDALADWLDYQGELTNRAYKLYVYASMFQEVDTTDQEAARKDSMASSLFGRSMAAMAFAEPEILALGKEKVDEWIADSPRLAAYAQSLDNLFRQQAHVRSAEVEELLGLAADPFFALNNISQTLRDADLTFRPAQTEAGEEVPVVQGNREGLLTEPDRTLRRTAYESYADAHLAFKNTLTATYATAVKRDVFYARARRYKSSLEASLFASNISPEVFHSLIDTYKKHLPTWHRYWRVRRQALGYKTLHPYDVKAPLSRAVPAVTYAQAVDWISEGMRPLGDDYVNALRQGALKDRWVDIYPNQGKRSGAFSSGAPGTHPFILMSFKDDLFSMSTLAHELGHSMHSYLTWQNQPLAYSNYSLFVAEVASNFNQAMTRGYLLASNPDPEFQIAVIEEAMSNFHRYFFIMPSLARFELEAHERVERGEGLSADGLNQLMYEIFKEGYGDEVEAEVEREGVTWAQFGHLYANFYVFQYATGISAAHALAAPILEGDEEAASRYVAFLSAGSSRYPQDVLEAAGVDMRGPEAVEKTFEVLSGYVDRLESLIAARNG